MIIVILVTPWLGWWFGAWVFFNKYPRYPTKERCTLLWTNKSLAGKSTILMVFTRKDGSFMGYVSFREGIYGVYFFKGYHLKATPKKERRGPLWSGTISHWFPLIRPAIRAGYFLGVSVTLGGVPLGSHENLYEVSWKRYFAETTMAMVQCWFTSKSSVWNAPTI